MASGSRSGVGGGRAEPVADLPAESFASGPFGRIVLVGSDDGSSSRLVAYDVAGACAWTLATERRVIRRATVDPAGATIYETRVDRASRADLGVWQRRLDGGPAGTDPRAAAATLRFGRTFSTEFTWAADGERLAVQACGEVACRTRIIDPGRLAAGDLDAARSRRAGRVDGDRAVTYARLSRLAVSDRLVDVRTGTRLTLDANGGPAVVAPDTRGRPARAIETARRDGPHPALDVPRRRGGSRPWSHPRRARLGLARSARLPRLACPTAGSCSLPTPCLPTGKPFAAQLRRIPDGMTVPFDEAMR